MATSTIPVKRSALKEVTSASQLAKYPPQILEYYGELQGTLLTKGPDR